MNLDLLRAVSNPPGLSGFEDEIQQVALASLTASCDEVWCDRLSNVIGLRRASDPVLEHGRPRRVVLAAHADEIGMVVKHVDEHGYIRFHPVGGIHAPSLISQHVLIHGRETIRGVIAPNTFEQREIPELKDILIDVARPREEVMRLVAVGDPITFAQEVSQLNDKVVTGRNFDDRIGTYCLLEAMRRLGRRASTSTASAPCRRRSACAAPPSSATRSSRTSGSRSTAALPSTPTRRPTSGRASSARAPAST